MLVTRQSALFAMATADVLLVNLWCHDIGREHGAGKPLLRTVLQVHLRMFSPRRTLLVFCVRDKTRTPEAILAQTLSTDLERLWAGLAKPVDDADGAPPASLSDYFDVRYVFLSNFEERHEQFLQDVAQLRSRLTNRDAPDSLAARPGTRDVPGSGLSLSVRTMWQAITENKDLDLPAHRVMVATVRCEQVAAAVMTCLHAHPNVARLTAAAGEHHAQKEPGLAAILEEALSKCLHLYDTDTQLFDASVRAAKRAQLMTSIMDVLRPLHDVALGAARTKALAAAKAALAAAQQESSKPAFNALATSVSQTAMKSFDTDAAEATPKSDACTPSIPDWARAVDAARARVHRDVSRMVETARCSRAQSVAQELTASFSRSLGPTVAAALDSSVSAVDVWPRLRRLLADEQRRASDALDEVLAPLLPTEFGLTNGDDIDDEDEDNESSSLSPRGINVAALRAALTAALAACVRDKVADAAAQVSQRLRARFADAFAHDPASGLPRAWGPRDDVDAAAASALRETVDLLTVLAVLRLDPAADAAADAARQSLHTLLPPAAAAAPAPGDAQPVAPEESRGGVSAVLSGSTWENLAVADWQLISPTACVAAWRALSTDTAVLVLQARNAQEAARRAAGGAPPLWAVAAMLILGFDEIMWLLRSPVTLLLLGTILLFGRAVYAHMDVDGTIAALGLVPSLAVLAARVVPSAVAVLQALIEAGAQAAQQGQQGQQGQGQQRVGAEESRKKED